MIRTRGPSSQKGLVLVYISTGRLSEADSSYKQMLEGFSDHPGLAQAVYEVARKYKDLRQFEKAQGVYQQLLANKA
ncbi:MAG: hypothetical protein QHH07_03010 [Sedimentisphaerales bacterium]|nr:hypothetical protein [Sedimentisphaerales bacterium]